MSKFYVTMTDKWMSGWGQAENKISKFVIECKTFGEACIAERNAKRRDGMVRVNIRISKPRYNDNAYHTSTWLYEDLGDCWKEN